MKDIALGITELFVVFEYSVAEYARKHGLEVNRLMIVILDALKEDIKKGALEVMANTNEETLTKAIERLEKEVKNDD